MIKSLTYIESQKWQQGLQWKQLVLSKPIIVPIINTFKTSVFFKIKFYFFIQWKWKCSLLGSGEDFCHKILFRDQSRRHCRFLPVTTWKRWWREYICSLFILTWRWYMSLLFLWWKLVTLSTSSCKEVWELLLFPSVQMTLRSNTNTMERSISPW